MNAFEKNGFFRTAAAILTLVLVFSVCEIVIRVYNKTQNRDRQIWIPDPYLGAVHAPDNRFLYDTDNNEEFSVWHQTNSFGLIGGEVSVRKPAGTTRVVVLGDSFTEALQVADHESFCALLQERALKHH